MRRTALDAVLRWKAAAAAEDRAKTRAVEALANEAERTIGLEWIPDHPSSGIACRSGRFRLNMTDLDMNMVEPGTVPAFNASFHDTTKGRRVYVSATGPTILEAWRRLERLIETHSSPASDVPPPAA